METADWSALPEDILLAGAVYASWRSAYATFGLCLPSPRQLLYACDAYGPYAAALYSSSANATLCVPLPHLAVLVGSPRGWPFANDEAANPYLLIPLTGAQVALPPVTAFQRVMSTSLDTIYGVAPTSTSVVRVPYTVETAAAADARDWSALLEDILLSAMEMMEVPDVVRSGAVCTSWRSAYATFRRLRLPSPRQPPCLLYTCDAYGPCAAALYSPSANATLRVPLPRRTVLAGSAHGWLFTTDAAANPYLLNPLTGTRAELPPVTTFKRMMSTSLDRQGRPVYHMDNSNLGLWSGPETVSVTADRACDWLYRQVALSAGGAAPSCVVLLVHEPKQEFSFARPGDERWTRLAAVEWFGRGFVSAVYNDKDGLFYVLQQCGSVHALDLHGPSPAERTVMRTWALDGLDKTYYLAVTPCGDLWMVVRRWCRSGGRRDTNGVGLYKLDLRTKKLAGRLKGIGDQHALFLGHSDAVCVPTRGFFPRIRPNCAYLTDDTYRTDGGGLLIYHRQSIAYKTPRISAAPVERERRDISVWDFESGSMLKLDDVWPLHPWLHTPAPIWITPSVY